MNREVKFEFIWQTEKTTVKQVITLDEIISGVAHPRQSGKKMPLLVKREFSGLTDNNGVEIYEGDLYNTTVLASHPTDRWGGDYWVKVTAKVGFINGGFVGIVVDHTKSSYEPEYKKGHFDGRITEIRDVEIIGNIYQNQELPEQSPDIDK